MLRNLAIALTALAGLVFATNLLAQGPGPGGPGGGFGGGRGMMGGGILMLVQNEKVQKEIELDADQKEKLQKLATETQESMRSMMGDMSDLSREERRAKMTEMRTKMEEATAKTQKKVEEILLPKQLERVKQIQLQVQGTMALVNPEVVKELGLTDDQKAKIKTINEESAKAMREMFSSGERPDREKMDKSRKETETKLMDVLTAEQKEKLEKLKGEKFDTSSLMRGPGGRRGNGGGGNGGGGPGGPGGPGPVN